MRKGGGKISKRLGQVIDFKCFVSIALMKERKKYTYVFIKKYTIIVVIDT